MTFLFIAWGVVGCGSWCARFYEFRNVRVLRPGLIELMLFIIFGPIPLLQSLIFKS